jgi:GNAT superfamily N-acetyltransferase
MIEIRTMRSDDIPLGLSLSRFAGWNQLEGDWRRLLALHPDSVFVAEYEGQPCGTASVTCYGEDLAWIGMVLVHPDLRRRGVASALIRHSLDYIRTARVRCIKLDATDLGRFVYSKLDFEDERPICRQIGPNLFTHLMSDLPPIGRNDWAAIARRDLEVFGADRSRLLRLLARDGVTAVAKSSHGIRGYGFARQGFSASFLGPMVADDVDTAQRLAAALLARLPDGPVYWDALPDNTAAREMAAMLGFRVERTLTRMRFGAMARPGIIPAIYAASGFETG